MWRSSTILVLGLAALAMLAQDVARGMNGAAGGEAGIASSSVSEDGSILMMISSLECLEGSPGLTAALELGLNSGALGEGVNSFRSATDLVLAVGVAYSARSSVPSFVVSLGFVYGAGDG